MVKHCVICGKDFVARGRWETCSKPCSLKLHIKSNRANARRRELEHPELVNATRRKRYAQHTGRRESNRRYRQENRKRTNEYSHKWYVEHREQGNTCTRKWYAEHRDRVRDTQRKWRSTEKGKALLAANKLRRRTYLGDETLSSDTVLDVKAEYLGICPYCNTKITRGHIDHIIPVSRGGTNARDNLVWACGKCNQQKSNKSLLRFMFDRVK